MAWQRFCTKCHKVFTPSKFNPYFKECPDCREAGKVRKVRKRKVAHCGICAKYLIDAIKPSMYWCPQCKSQYSVLGGGYWLDIQMQRLWYKDQQVGGYEFYGDLRRCIDEHARIHGTGGVQGGTVQVVA